MSTIVTIAGSPSQTSRSGAVLDYVVDYLQNRHITTQSIKVRDLDPAELLYADWNGATIKAAIEQITAADAVIIATPIYKAAYTGILKAFLDMLPQKALENKVVLPIATGGSAAHMLAVDYALKPVLAALGVQHSLKTIYIIDQQVSYGTEAGLVFNDTDIETRLHSGLQQLIQAIPTPELF